MSTRESRIEAIREAIASKGSQRNLALAIDVTQSSVSKWLRGVVPDAENAVKIERATGVDRRRVRPDIFESDSDPTGDRHNGVRA